MSKTDDSEINSGDNDFKAILQVLIYKALYD